MNCKPCAKAGDLISRPDKDNPGIRRQARLHHQHCTSPKTCTCQHRVPLSELEKEENGS